MFITQGPYHQKRNFKFSHRLAGQTYNNDKYLEHSRLPRPTSALPSAHPSQHPKPRHTQSASQPRSFLEPTVRFDETDRRASMRKKSLMTGTEHAPTKRGSLV